MNIVYLIGMILTIAFVLFGIMVDMSAGFAFLPDRLGNFFDASSVLIVIGGTFGVIIACYPKTIKALIKHFAIMFKSNSHDPNEYVDKLIDLAQIARKNGLLALEEKANAETDSFFKQAIGLIVDANDPARVRNVLENDMEQASERHHRVIAMYEKGSATAPALGMVGTLIGLINMLSNLDGGDMSSLGPNMSTAMITTLYGSLLAHVFFTPIATNLKARDEEEYLCRQIIIEGIMAIQAGENPKFLREFLLVFMNQKLREQGQDGGKGKKGKKGGGDAAE